MISTNLIYLVWLPVALAVVLGIVGLFRGAVREALVSVSVLLGALIIQTWAALWAGDAVEAFPSLDRTQTELALNIVVMGLVVLVVGYLLGSALVSRADTISASSRLAGALIGLANGAAIGGWLLRLGYLANPSGGQLDNDVSKYLIIWAGWFPLVAALVGAIVALVGPVRRARTRVAEPAPQTNWTPATPASSPPPAAPYPPGGMYGAAYPPSAAASTSATQPYTPAPNLTPPPYTPGVGSVATTTAFPVQDSSRTPVLPAERPYAPESQPQLQQQATAPYNASGYSSATAAPPVLGATDQSVARYSSADAPAADSGFRQKDEPSWLVKATPSVESGAGMTPSPETSHAPISQNDTAHVELQPESSAAQANSAESVDSRTCPNCGASLPANARFCTDCGAPLS